MCHLLFRDHLQIERELKNVASDKITTVYAAKNIMTIVNLKAINQPLTKENRNFIDDQPKLRKETL